MFFQQRLKKIEIKLMLIFLVLTILFSISTFGQELNCAYLHHIEQGFINKHITYKELSPKLQKRTIEQYIKKLDSSKVYFLQKDVDKISNLLANIFNKVAKRDCSSLEKVQKIYIKKIKERLDYAKKYLKNKKFKINKKLSFVLDPDKRAYPKTIEKLNSFHEKYLQFQVANYLATDLKKDEAVDHVIRNYERLVRRIKSTNHDDIYSSYLDAFARSLDPHSSFFSKDTLEDFEISMSLSLEGIGATLSFQDGFTVVEQLVPGGAAERSGLVKTKDKIIAVGQGKKGVMENVIEMELRDVVKKIRGSKGTLVRLTILRETSDGKKRFNINLVRDKIKLEDDAAYVIYVDKTIAGKKHKFAILNLPSFYSDSKENGRSSAGDVKKLLQEIKKKNVSGLLFDLSNNGGGSLEDAVKIAGLFIKKGNIVKQSTQVQLRTLEQALKDKDKNIYYSGPLVILTSRISASASEIVAGALKDYKRALVVGGDHTFGKGSIQSVIPIPQNLGALKVTVGMFFIPGGDSTQHKGVIADISFPSIFSYDEIGEKSLDYSLPPMKIASFVSPEAYITKGKDAWQKISTNLIKEVKAESQKRVSKNEDFNKIVEELKSAKEKGKVLHINDILKSEDSSDSNSNKKNKKNGNDGNDGKDNVNKNGEKSQSQKIAQKGKDDKAGDKKVDDGKKESDKKKKKNKNGILSKEEKEKEYLKRADVQEAVNILEDMVSYYEVGTKKK